MKRFGLLFLAILSVCLFLSASVWEGAGTISPSGLLPEEGYYAATNSFPRNTVVDITNLETRKTIRVIVAAGLDSPGLLAMVSRDAANAIGLTSTAIGRIRMSMPNDPIAFSRFSEDLSPSGDPDHDPRAAVSQHTGSANPPGSGDASAFKDDFYSSNNKVVDIPETYSPSALNGVDDSVTAVTPPHSVWIYPEEIDETLNGSGTAAETVIIGEEIPEGITEYPEFFVWESAGDSQAHADEDFPEESLSPDHALALDSLEPELEPPALHGTGETITLIPADERPPEVTIYDILPEDAEINPLPDAILSETAPAGDVYIPEDHFINPVNPVVEGIPPYTSNTPVPPTFSVPMIYNLERGKYYLQLGAFSKTDSVEQVITNVGKSYPLSVQPAGTTSSPVYRVLLGPVNLGESAALLQRFKTIGYKDAFIRQES